MHFSIKTEIIHFTIIWNAATVYASASFYFHSILFLYMLFTNTINSDVSKSYTLKDNFTLKYPIVYFYVCCIAKNNYLQCVFTLRLNRYFTINIKMLIVFDLNCIISNYGRNESSS